MRTEPHGWDRLERWPAPAVLAGAVGAGVAWGVLARLWMRVISTDPEFTTSGSVFIVGAFAVAATGQGVAIVTRRRGRSVVRIVGRLVGLLGMLPLFIGAGAAMLPTVVGGGLAVGQRTWPRPLRVLAAVVGLVPIVGVTASIADDFGLHWRLVAGASGLVLLYGGIVLAVTASLGRNEEARPLPRTLRVAGLVAATLLLLLATVGAAGLRG